MKKLKDYLEQVKRNPKILIIIGFAGIIFIFISAQLDLKGEPNDKKQEIVLTAEQYSSQVEEKLATTIQKILGGKVNVFLTLETGIEYIYASEIKSDSKEVENVNGAEKSELHKDGKNENKYVIITDKNGNEIPLVITQIMPKVKGVVVVCNSGNNEQVQRLVISAVTTALNIPDTKVCVMGYLA